MPFEDTAQVGTDFVCLNPNNSATGNVSVFSWDAPVLLKITTSSDKPTTEKAAIPLGIAGNGHGVYNTTLAALLAGTTGTYIHAKLQAPLPGGQTGRVTVAVA